MKTLNYITLFCSVFFLLFIMNSCSPEEEESKNIGEEEVDSEENNNDYGFDDGDDYEYIDPTPEPDYIADGATPWKNCFGRNSRYSEWDGTEIIINTSSLNPVIAIVKRGGRILKHAYIDAGSKYTFYQAPGTYEVFFYYGEIWDEDKKMDSEECSDLLGGWYSNEKWQKDPSFYLPSGQTLTYTLTNVVNGNFTPDGSSESEAL